MSDTTQLALLTTALVAVALTILTAATDTAKLGFQAVNTSIASAMEQPACPPPAGATNGDTP